MRNICRLCGWDANASRKGRSSHLRDEHGIETYKGIIKEYFIER